MMTTKRSTDYGDQPAAPDQLAPTAAEQLREIAHELRNPLNALTAIMEIMKDQRFGPLGDQRYQEYAALAHDATTKMMDLCNRLVQTPGPADTVHRVEVASLLANIAAMYRPMAEARGLTLDVDVPDDLPDIQANPEALGTVLSNLVTNAIKFTPRGGRVSLLARKEPLENVAVFVVSDSGVGLDPEMVAHTMPPAGETFEPSPTVGAHGDTGSGLGLIIIRRTVTDLGGTLELRSAKGVGTCAIVRLPLGMAEPGR
ncbi:MAG: HAMP domain-containing histidine kinase [Alphaproteobacteria bacterium]|nr:HAMP domain-containing histidine kinase [Alphaproteobacteria bacterium]